MANHGNDIVRRTNNMEWWLLRKARYPFHFKGKRKRSKFIKKTPTVVGEIDMHEFRKMYGSDIVFVKLKEA